MKNKPLWADGSQMAQGGEKKALRLPSNRGVVVTQSPPVVSKYETDLPCHCPLLSFHRMLLVTSCLHCPWFSPD